MHHELADMLDEARAESDDIPSGRLRVLLGRKINGYSGHALVRSTDYVSLAPGCTITDAHMLTCRLTTTFTCVPYTEPAVTVETELSNEILIHKLANQTRQHHYIIEYFPIDEHDPRAILHETQWAT